MNRYEESVNIYFAGEIGTPRKQPSMIILKFMENKIKLFLLISLFTNYITRYFR